MLIAARQCPRYTPTSIEFLAAEVYSVLANVGQSSRIVHF